MRNRSVEDGSPLGAGRGDRSRSGRSCGGSTGAMRRPADWSALTFLVVVPARRASSSIVMSGASVPTLTAFYVTSFGVNVQPALTGPTERIREQREGAVMPMNLDAVGTSSESVEREWSSTDCLLYTLGVGAGSLDPTGLELEFTTENSAGIRQQVLPTFAALAGRRQQSHPAVGTTRRRGSEVRRSSEPDAPAELRHPGTRRSRSGPSTPRCWSTESSRSSSTVRFPLTARSARRPRSPGSTTRDRERSWCSPPTRSMPETNRPGSRPERPCSSGEKGVSGALEDPKVVSNRCLTRARRGGHLRHQAGPGAALQAVG